MATVSISYEGHLHTECKHNQSQSIICTDAPTDNHGKGENFSPTDLVATAFATCTITIMGIKAENLGIDLKGTTLEVVKTMSADLPRRISKLEVEINLPSKIGQKERTILEKSAHTCPVHYSLAPEIEKLITFNWDSF